MHHELGYTRKRKLTPEVMHIIISVLPTSTFSRNIRAFSTRSICIYMSVSGVHAALLALPPTAPCHLTPAPPSCCFISAPPSVLDYRALDRALNGAFHPFCINHFDAAALGPNHSMRLNNKFNLILVQQCALIFIEIKNRLIHNARQIVAKRSNHCLEQFCVICIKVASLSPVHCFARIRAHFSSEFR